MPVATAGKKVRRAHSGKTIKQWSSFLMPLDGNKDGQPVVFTAVNSKTLQATIDKACGSKCTFTPGKDGIVLVYNSSIQQKLGEYTDDSPIGFIHAANVPEELGMGDVLQSLVPRTGPAIHDDDMGGYESLDDLLEEDAA